MKVLCPSCERLVELVDLRVERGALVVRCPPATPSSGSSCLPAGTALAKAAETEQASEGAGKKRRRSTRPGGAPRLHPRRRTRTRTTRGRPSSSSPRAARAGRWPSLLRCRRPSGARRRWRASRARAEEAAGHSATAPGAEPPAHRRPVAAPRRARRRPRPAGWSTPSSPSSSPSSTTCTRRRRLPRHSGRAPAATGGTPVVVPSRRAWPAARRSRFPPGHCPKCIAPRTPRGHPLPGLRPGLRQLPRRGAPALGGARVGVARAGGALGHGRRSTRSSSSWPSTWTSWPGPGASTASGWPTIPTTPRPRRRWSRWCGWPPPPPRSPRAPTPPSSPRHRRKVLAVSAMLFFVIPIAALLFNILLRSH